MPTTVHIPDELLKRVDQRAKALKLTRNRYIVEALRKVLAEQTAWSPTFLEQLERLEPIAGVDEMLAGINAGRACERRRVRTSPCRSR